MQSMYRPRDNRMVAGVCSGIGRRFGIDPTIVRLAFVASMLLPGPQILLYIVGWVLIPEEFHPRLITVGRRPPVHRLGAGAMSGLGRDVPSAVTVLPSGASSAE